MGSRLVDVSTRKKSDHNQNSDFLTAAEKGDFMTVIKLCSGLDYPKVSKQEADDFLNQTNNVEKTALILAATKGDVRSVITLCLFGAKIDDVDCGGWDASKYASYYNRQKGQEIVEILQHFREMRRKLLSA